MSQLGLAPFYRATDSNGNPLASARLYTFATGTTTPQATYTTDALSVSHGPYVQGDSAGLMPPFYLDPTKVYRIQERIAPYTTAIPGKDFDPVNNLSASSIQFLQAGAGAVALSAQTKMRQTVNAADFGFATAGTGAANATALTAAMTALASGGIVNIGPGTFTLDMVNVPANIILQGAGIDATILTQGTLLDASYGMLYAESGSSSTYIENISVRDMTLYNSAGTFSEFVHLAAFAGVKHLRFERVKFKAFRGDGLCLHTRAVSSSAERHNIDAQVIDCIFDGVNNENRQGISITDCDGFAAIRCKFITCGKSTMPGAIDFEPDQTYSIIRNCGVLFCTFEAVGGNLGAVAVYVPATTALPLGINIIGNFFKSLANNAAIFVGVNRTLTAASADMAVNIQDNTGTVGVIPIDLRACKDVRLPSTNSFQSFTNPCQIGFNGATDLAWDVEWDVRLMNCAQAGGADTAGIYVSKVDGLKLGGSLYKCGDDMVNSYPIRFTANASNRVTIRNLDIVLNANQTVAIEATGHTFTAPATNRFDTETCDLGGGTNEFPSADPVGTAVLVAGVVAVAATGVTATSKILVNRNTDGGTPGCSYSITRTPGTSFTITSKRSDGTTTETSDLSTIAYEVIP